MRKNSLIVVASALCLLAVGSAALIYALRDKNVYEMQTVSLQPKEKAKEIEASQIPHTNNEPILYYCDFETGFKSCGFEEHSKSEGLPNGDRVSLVAIARTGLKGIRLTTKPGDNNVHGSGEWERTDLRLSNELSDCAEGKEAWWAHSVYFPDDFSLSVVTTVMDFHNSSEGGNANFHLISDSKGLRLHGFGGDQAVPVEYRADLGRVKKNAWYDFVYHVKWSAGRGFMEAWMNGRKVLSHTGPTLYTGQFCYLKLANYHKPTEGTSSIIHDRLIRAISKEFASLTPIY